MSHADPTNCTQCRREYTDSLTPGDTANCTDCHREYTYTGDIRCRDCARTNPTWPTCPVCGHLATRGMTSTRFDGVPVDMCQVCADQLNDPECAYDFRRVVAYTVVRQLRAR